MLQCVRIGGIDRIHLTAYWDVFLFGDNHRVGMENRAFIYIQNEDLNSCCGATTVHNVWDQWLFIFHFDQERVVCRNLTVQRLEEIRGQDRQVLMLATRVPSNKLALLALTTT